MGKSTKPPSPAGYFFSDEDKGGLASKTSADTVEKVNKKAKRLKFDPKQQAVIGQHLQALYDEIVNQSLPDKLKDLLGSLDELPKKSGQ